MSEGIPVLISEEDQPIFYEKLDTYINSAPNDFESFYIKGKNELAISDKYIDYLTVTYEDSKLVFKTTEHTNSPVMKLDKDVQQKMGLAFLGVFLFVEKLSPSGDMASLLSEISQHE